MFSVSLTDIEVRLAEQGWYIAKRRPGSEGLPRRRLWRFQRPRLALSLPDSRDPFCTKDLDLALHGFTQSDGNADRQLAQELKEARERRGTSE